MKPIHFDKIKEQYQSHESARKDVSARSNEILSKSKQAIFALHRDAVSQADLLFLEIEKLFLHVEKVLKKFPNTKQEGAYRAALEEYAEAKLFYGYVQKKSFGIIPKRAMESSIYLSGLSDATGEVVRFSMKQITLGHLKEVEKAKQVVEEVIEMMYALDLTGYLRTKFDQAKNNLRRLEEMIYELSLRTRN